MTLARRSCRSVCLGFVVGFALLAAACTPDEVASTEPAIVEVPRLVTPASTIGFESSTGVFSIGVIADLSGPGSVIAQGQVAGAEAYWSTVNAGGGVDGRFLVELVVRDTAGSAANAVVAYRELRDSVVMMGQIVGTDNTDAVRELLRADGVLGVPTTRQLQWALTENLIPLGSSYAVEAISGISYMVERDGGSRVWCVVSDQSKEGQDSLFGAVLASQNLVEVPVFGNVANEEGADFVLDDAGPGDEIRLVAEAVDLGCERLWLASDAETSTRVIGQSAVAAAEFDIGVGSEVGLPFPDHVVPWATDHVVVVVDAPSWGDAGLGARALRDAVDRYVPDVRPNSWLRSGFTSQYAVDVVLTSSVRDGDLSRERLLSLRDRLGPVDTGGLAGSVDWSEDPPTIPTMVTIHAVDQVGVDPLGLKVQATYTSPIVDAVTADR